MISEHLNTEDRIRKLERVVERLRLERNYILLCLLEDDRNGVTDAMVDIFFLSDADLHDAAKELRERDDAGGQVAL